MEILVQTLSVLISLGLVAVLLSGPDGADQP